MLVHYKTYSQFVQPNYLELIGAVLPQLVELGKAIGINGKKKLKADTIFRRNLKKKHLVFSLCARYRH